MISSLSNILWKENMAIIKFDSVSLQYGDKAVFSDLSFELEANSKVLLKGKSGSGKSSIFNLIMGFLPPNSGKLLYNDKQYFSIQEIRQHIAWIPQEINLFPEETVYNGIFDLFDNKRMLSHKPTKSEIDSIAGELLLEKRLLEGQFKLLSGGEKQRVGVLIALLMNRDLTLADEPTSALDPTIAEAVMSSLLKHTKTLLCISHSSDFDALFDNVIHLEEFCNA